MPHVLHSYVCGHTGVFPRQSTRLYQSHKKGDVAAFLFNSYMGAKRQPLGGAYWEKH